MVKELFGTLPSGENVYSYTLENKNGMSIKVIEYGAMLISIKVPTKNGEKEELTIGNSVQCGYKKWEKLRIREYSHIDKKFGQSWRNRECRDRTIEQLKRAGFDTHLVRVVLAIFEKLDEKFCIGILRCEESEFRVFKT
jgi:hypothetical protein